MRSPGVGENLQDHLQLRTIFRIAGARTLNVEFHSLLRRAGMALDYALRRRGPLTMAPSQVGIFAKSSPDFATRQSSSSTSSRCRSTDSASPCTPFPPSR